MVIFWNKYFSCVILPSELKIKLSTSLCLHYLKLWDPRNQCLAQHHMCRASLRNVKVIFYSASFIHTREGFWSPKKRHLPIIPQKYEVSLGKIMNSNLVLKEVIFFLGRSDKSSSPRLPNLKVMSHSNN